MEDPFHDTPEAHPQSPVLIFAHGPPKPIHTLHTTVVPNAGLLEEDIASIPSDDDLDDTPSKRDRIKIIAHQIKAVPKRMLMRADIVTQVDPQLDADAKEIPGITDNPAFNIAMLEDKPEHGVAATLALKPVHALEAAGKFIAHPINSAKRSAAGKVTVAEHPYLPEGMDKELLQAHHDSEHVTADTRSSLLTSEEEADLEESKEKIHELQTRRETLRTAWVTGKHVRRVKAVILPLVPVKPRSEDFNEYDQNGNFVRWNWEMYTGQLALYESQDFVAQHAEDTNDVYFTRAELTRQAERLLVASAPIQAYFMHVHKVYLWEDRILTTRWLFTWLFLMKTGYITTFAYWWIAYIVVKNRLTKDNVRFLRESQERIDSGGRPYKISELVGRHGGEDWVDPLLDELGPLIQRQLSDVADYCEILMNFYHWRNPKATMQSVFLWFILGLVAALCSTEYGLKIVVFVAGIYFFMSRPIASKYPRWRKVVSLPRWIHWDIPNNAELAFQALREDAQKAQRRMGNTDIQIQEEGTGQIHAGPMPGVTVDNASPKHHKPGTAAQNEDILSFRGSYDSHLGRLIITSTSLRFIRTSKVSTSSADDILFAHPYADLLDLRKTHSSALRVSRSKKALNTDALTILLTDNTSITIESMRKRDEAFNALIAFSGQRWTVQQPLEGVRNGGGGVSQGSGTGGKRTKEENRTGEREYEDEEVEGMHDGRAVLEADGELAAGEKGEHANGNPHGLARLKEKARSVLHLGSDGDGGKKHESSVLQQATEL